MTTPNTTGPSDEIQRYHHSRAVDDVFASKNGKYVLHSDHLSALSRAREEARREALEEAAQFCLQAPFGFYPSQIDLRVQFARLIRESANPTPQGETKEQKP